MTVQMKWVFVRVEIIEYDLDDVIAVKDEGVCVGAVDLR